MPYTRIRLTGVEGDVHVLDVARCIANKKDVSVVVLLPKNYKIAFSTDIKKKFGSFTHLSTENEKLTYMVSDADASDLSSYLNFTSVGQSSYDLVVCGFTTSLGLRQEEPPLGARNPSASAGVIDEHYIEELGVIGSSVKNGLTSGYLIVIHELLGGSNGHIPRAETETQGLNFSLRAMSRM